MSIDLRRSLTSGETWMRLLYVILFAAIYTVGEIVLVAVVIVQFGFVLITGRRNRNLLNFGGSLSRFMYDVLLYFTFKTDIRPFPFDDWPATGRTVPAGKKVVKKKPAAKKKPASS